MTSRPDRGLRGKKASDPGPHRGDRLLILGLGLGLAIVYGFAAYTYYSNADGIFDSTGHTLGRDFVVYWIASTAALAGQAIQIFDTGAFHALQEQILERSFPLHPWPYPPHTLFYVLPLGLLPYLWSYAFWSIATFALYLTAAVGKNWASLTSVALILAPATAVNFAFGQNGYLSAALLIGGMRLVDSRPILAGCLFGLLSFKPQMGLLIPIALVAARLWTTFISATLTVMLLVALSLAIFGPEAWEIYITKTSTDQKGFLEYGSGPFVNMMPTPFMALRILGVDISVGYLVQAVFALGILPCVYWVFRGPADRKLQSAALIVAVFLVTPYAFNYDMTILSVAVLWALSHAVKTGFMPGEKLLYAMVWILPIAVMAANSHGLPLAPLVLMAFFAVLLARIKGWAPKHAASRSIPSSVYAKGH